MRKHVFDVWCVTGGNVEIGQWDSPLAVPMTDMDERIQGNERDGQI